MWNQVIAHRHVHLHEAEHNSLQKEVDRAVKKEVDANRDFKQAASMGDLLVFLAIQGGRSRTPFAPAENRAHWNGLLLLIRFQKLNMPKMLETLTP